mmetsp:Transcript_18724/g.29715  ORF Transcript_18724/g.29715 Transcript_18724/m.29715 type:complete len:204 (+) Transcript_18724:1050-1661(+)
MSSKSESASIIVSPRSNSIASGSSMSDSMDSADASMIDAAKPTFFLFFFLFFLPLTSCSVRCRTLRVPVYDGSTMTNLRAFCLRYLLYFSSFSSASISANKSSTTDACCPCAFFFFFFFLFFFFCCCPSSSVSASASVSSSVIGEPTVSLFGSALLALLSNPVNLNCFAPAPDVLSFDLLRLTLVRSTCIARSASPIDLWKCV